MDTGKHFKAYLVGGFSAIGGFLFGYHTGVISGVLIMKDFQNMTGISNNGIVSNLDTSNGRVGSIVGLLLAGCFFGSLIGGQTSDRFSRKYSISFFAFIFTISAAIQTGSSDNAGFAMILIGRFFAGISIGALSMIVPIYHSEIAATKIRGRLITLQQWAITIGIAASYWINYGLSESSRHNKRAEWQIPLGLQMVPSMILAIGILFCPFSPRWLISQDREDEAKDVLMKIRSTSTDEIEEEIDRIKVEVAFLRENEMDSYGQLFHAPLLRPLLLGIGIQVLQQLTGINTTIYYTPRLFAILLNHNASASASNSVSDDTIRASLLATAVYGCVNVLFTIPTIIFVDRLGRRLLLITGAAIMSIGMLVVSIVMATQGDCSSDNSDSCTCQMESNSSPFWSILIFLNVFVAGFAFSWGPVAWIYCTEIFPLTMRAKATSLTTAANWATNCILSFLAPILFKHMYYGLFLFSSIICAIMIGIVYRLYPETKDKHLEEAHMFERDRIFGPEHVEDSRGNYNTFPAQSNNNSTRTLNIGVQNSTNESNEINDSIDQSDDFLSEKDVHLHETVH